MKKKELLKMPVLELTEKMRKKALSAKPEKKCEWSNEIRYNYNTYFRAVVEKEILRIEVYFTHRIRSGCMRPAYRIFFDKKADDFLTFDMEKQKWTSSRIDNLKWPGSYSNWDDRLYLEREEETCVVDYLGLKSFQDLDYWQCKRREKQRLSAYERRAGKWDAIMREIPPLPKDWGNWIKKHVITEHYMFYTYKSSGKITGRCSCCGKEQILYKPKYNKKGVCKSCRHPVTYKSTGKCGRIWTKNYTAHILQRMGSSIVSRQFRACAFYPKGQFDKPEISVWEERRLLMDQNGKEKAYYFGEYKDKKLHWIETDVCHYKPMYSYSDPRYYTEKGTVYKRTLPDLAKKELKRTGIWQIVKTGQPIAPEIYLLAVKEKPVIEKAAKAGIERLAFDLVTSTWNIQLSDSGPLHQCLNIDRNQLKRLRANNGDSEFLKWLQFEGKYQKKIDDEVIAFFIRNEIKADQISFITDRMSPRQTMNYLIKQQKKGTGESWSKVLFVWSDYLNMVKKCGGNVHDPIIFRAADLWKRHDEMVLRIEKQKNENRAREILEQYPNLNHIFASLKEKYSYQNETYAVVVPENVEELLHEGDTLHHCVNKTDNYFERISNGESYILFLRKTDELSVPYYTLEVEPGGTIRQKRTEFNRQNEDIAEASEFLKMWQKVIRKRMTEKDLALAKRSRKLRTDEYEKLRKNGQAIGQGIYGGQLLVDLLESDLMEITDAA